MVESQQSHDVESEPTRGGGIAAVLWQPGVLVLVVVALVATVVVPKIIDRLPELGDRAEYRLTRDSVEIIPVQPNWVPEEFVLSVTGSKTWPEDGTSVFEPDLLERVAESFAAQPWVAEVRRVERRVPAGVAVWLEFRRPVAWIETAGPAVAVDVTGVRLPREDLVETTAEKLPVVRGVTSEPPDADAVAWNDPGVVAAARLAVELESHWVPFDLAAIVVKRDQDLVTLELLTRGGSRVVWGRPPGTRHLGELTVSQKIGRIMQFISHFDSLDPPDGPYEINIRHWHEIIYRPLRSESARTMVLPVVR